MNKKEVIREYLTNKIYEATHECTLPGLYKNRNAFEEGMKEKNKDQLIYEVSRFYAFMETIEETCLDLMNLDEDDE